MSENYRLGLKDAARLHGVGYQRLWGAVKAEELPALRVGTRWLVRPEDVETYLHSIGEANAAEKARAAS